MNREAYRKAFDAIPFSPDFQDRTTELLRDRLREQEKEKHIMYVGKTKKLAVLVAAAIALLAVSVSAVMLWMSPTQVAERLAELMALLRSYKLEPKELQTVQKTIDTPPRLVLLRCRKDGGTGLDIRPPLLLQNEDGTETEALRRCYFRDRE